MIVENHSDEQRKGLMEQEDHQNFDQHYQSNLNENSFLYRIELINKYNLLISVSDKVEFSFLNSTITVP
jgi:hypothetical protein